MKKFFKLLKLIIFFVVLIIGFIFLKDTLFSSNELSEEDYREIYKECMWKKEKNNENQRRIFWEFKKTESESIHVR